MAIACPSKTAIRSLKASGVPRLSVSRRSALRVVATNGDAVRRAQVVQPLNGDPFVGMLETPVTSSPIIASYLSNLPAYRTGVSCVLRGVEIGLAHGFLMTGPFIKLGPLRNTPEAEIVGCAAAAGLVVILTVCLSIYGQSAFQTTPSIGVKTLTGRMVARDPLQSAKGWDEFTAGWLIGGVSSCAFAYILTQVLPYYS
jgi:photosystem I subunit 11